MQTLSTDTIVLNLVLEGCRHIMQALFELNCEVINFPIGYVILPNHQNHPARCVLIRGLYGTYSVIALVRLLKEVEEPEEWIPQAIRVEVNHKILRCEINEDLTLKLSKK